MNIKIQPSIKAFAVSSLIVGIAYFISFFGSTILGLSMLSYIDSPSRYESVKGLYDFFGFLLIPFLPLSALFLSGVCISLITKKKGWLYAGLFGFVWSSVLISGSLISRLSNFLQNIHSSSAVDYSRVVYIVLVIVGLPMFGALVGSAIYKMRKGKSFRY